MSENQRDTYYLQINTAYGKKPAWEHVTLEDVTHGEALIRLKTRLAELYCHPGDNVDQWWENAITTNYGPDRFAFKNSIGGYILADIESATQRQHAEEARKQYAIEMQEREKVRNAKLAEWKKSGPYTRGLVDPEAWQAWLDNNQDGYGGACMDIARRVMEYLDEGGDFDANDLINRADDEFYMGLTGFMAGAVAQTVSVCHVRGEEFRRSWNREIGKATGQEYSDGVLNPALLSFEPKEE